MTAISEEEEFEFRRRAEAERATTAKPRPRRNWQGEVTGFMANVNRGLGIGDELAAAGNTAVNVFSGKVPLSSVGDDFNRSMAEQRRIEDSYAADRPNAAALARGTGMAATAAVPAGNTANLFAQGGRAVNAARGATLAATQGAAYAAVDRGSARERLAASSRAARDPLTLAIGAVGGRMATPRKVNAPKPVNPDVQLLAGEGVQMTPGQMAGGRIAKQTEEAAVSIPFAGDRISDRIGDAQDSFNVAILNRALKPVGEKIPANMGAGTDAIAYTGDRLSRAYRQVLPEGTITPDARFLANVKKIGSILETVDEKAQKNVVNIIDKRVSVPSAADGGVLSGRTFKKIETGLDLEIKRYSGSSDPANVATKEALEVVRDSLADLAARQNPKFKTAKDAIDRGWATLAQAETAAAAAGTEAGRFSPKQYTAALRAGDSRIRRRGLARGEVLNQDIAQAGERVLAQRLPDSGTGRRLIQGGVGLGAVTSGAIVPAAAAIGATSVAYSPKAVALANRLLNQRIGGQEQRALMAQLAQEAANDPSAQELYRQVAAKLSRAAGVAGGSQAGQSPNLFAQP